MLSYSEFLQLGNKISWKLCLFNIGNDWIFDFSLDKMAHLLSYLLDKAIDTFSSGVSRLPRSRKSKLDDTILGSFLICVLKSSSLFAIYIYIEFYVILDRHMHRKLIWIVFQLSRGMKNKTGSFSSLSLDFMSNLPLINATFFARFIGWHSLI